MSPWMIWMILFLLNGVIQGSQQGEASAPVLVFQMGFFDDYMEHLDHEQFIKVNCLNRSYGHYFSYERNPRGRFFLTELRPLQLFQL